MAIPTEFLRVVEKFAKTSDVAAGSGAVEHAEPGLQAVVPCLVWTKTAQAIPAKLDCCHLPRLGQSTSASTIPGETERQIGERPA